MTYEESAALMKDAAFVSRIKVACLNYAAYISDEAVSVPAHTSRMRWAQNTMLNPDAAAMQVTPSTVITGQVQTDGGAITDAALQTSVESVVNKLI